MLGIIYFVICLVMGRAIETLTRSVWEEAAQRLPNPFWLRGVLQLFCGTLCVTWLVYGVSYCLQAERHPLAYGNGIVLPATAVCAAAVLWMDRRRGKAGKLSGVTDRKLFWREGAFYLAVFLFISWWMWYVFHASEGVLYAGFTVFGDFSPHTAMIRSFSWGNNFPTQYPYFGGEDVKYHFMFQFLTGNLEYLGIPMEIGFLLTGAVFFTGMVILVCTLAQWIFQRFSIGVLAGILLCFRSSFSFWRFVWEHLEAGDLWETLKTNTEFIGYTANESWGLWNLNVYLNQRHLAFGLCALGLALLLYLPDLDRGCSRQEKGWRWFWNRVFGVESWKSRNIGRAIFLGVLLGASVFWNGAVVIAALLVLAGFAMFSDGKLDYVVTAGITLAASAFQSAFFMDGAGMELQFQFGFLAQEPTLKGCVVYLLALTGLFFPLLGLTIPFLGKLEKCLAFAFSLPLVFAFTVSLTPDIAVNHKYVMISILLCAILVAKGLTQLLGKKAGQKVLAGFLVLMLTVTGLYDMVVIYKDNDASHSFQIAKDDDVTEWLRENIDSEDLVLTPQYSLTRVTVSGIMMYCGWPYYGWSAGYDTDYRTAVALEIYQTEDSGRLRELVRDEGITYVIYEDNMQLDGQSCEEGTISETYPQAYCSEDGTLRIYRTSESRERAEEVRKDG